MTSTTTLRKILIIGFVTLCTFALFTHVAHAADESTSRGFWGTVKGVVTGDISFSDALISGVISILESTRGAFVSLMLSVAKLFGYAVENFATIEGFNNLYRYVADPIATVWTFVRDLANIVIIGLFVFIAISIILGLKEYGQKKLIARVLIVAILINFSFLFTRIIINATNALSSQVYTSLVKQVAGESIAKKYVDMMDLMKINNTSSASKKLPDKDPPGRLELAFSTFITSMIFTIASTLMFLYGSILLMGRFIILLVALILSSLAFASYLLPNWSAAIWSKWWEALLKNAILGPLMMIFIWASITLSQGISKQMLENKDLNALEPSVLTGFVLVLGTLFMGMYIASSFSTQMAQRMALVGTALPITFGSRFGVAPVARQIIGRYAMGQAEFSKKQAQGLSLRSAAAERLGNHAEARRLSEASAAAAKRSSRFENLAGRKFNPMDTGMAQSLTKALKLGGASGTSTKSTVSVTEANKVRETAASKVASKAEPTKDAVNKMADKVSEEVKKASERQIDVARKAHGSNVTAHGTERSAALAERDRKQSALKQAEQELGKMLKGKTGDMAQQRRLIESAQIEARHASEAVAAVDEKWSTKLRDSQAALTNLQSTAEKEAKQAAGAFKEAIHHVGEDTQREIARNTGTFLQRVTGALTGDTKRVQDAVVSHVRKHHKQERIKDVLGAAGGGHDDGHGHGDAKGDAHH